MQVGVHKGLNIFKTWILISASLILVIGIGFVFSEIYGNPAILYFFAGFAILINFISYWFSASLALKMSGARPVKEGEESRFSGMINNLSDKYDIPMPRLYKIEGGQINAFATGRNPKNSAVAVTRGALEKLDDKELEGVLAHELSHIKNRDILVSTIVVMMSAMISIASRFFLFGSLFGGGGDRNGGGAVMLVVSLVVIILAPLIGLVIQLAVSRKREYLADASGAALLGDGEGLASALEKIGNDHQELRQASTATSHLFISSPLKGKEAKSWFVKLFMTHPPLSNRVKILRGFKF